MQWTKLVVHAHETTDSPDKSFVDFSAYGTEEGVEKVHHEKAEFLRVNGACCFTTGRRGSGPRPDQVRRPQGRAERPLPLRQREKVQALLPGQGLTPD